MKLVFNVTSLTLLLSSVINALMTATPVTPMEIVSVAILLLIGGR